MERLRYCLLRGGLKHSFVSWKTGLLGNTSGLAP